MSFRLRIVFLLVLAGSGCLAVAQFRRLQPKCSSIAAFKQSMMPGEVRMFDATPRFWEALQKAGLPLT